jgi:hypothetical protein
MKVGSLVECIKSFTAKETNGENVPILGNIYTVRDITKIGGNVGLRLEEIINYPQLYKEGVFECAFFIERFREIQPPLDIDIESLIETPIECA